MIQIPRDYWIPDSSSRVCFTCETPFTFFTRKHHCRLCGLIFCHDCCNQRYFFEEIATEGRVCEKCFENAAEQQARKTTGFDASEVLKHSFKATSHLVHCRLLRSTSLRPSMFSDDMSASVHEGSMTKGLSARGSDKRLSSNLFQPLCAEFLVETVQRLLAVEGLGENWVERLCEYVSATTVSVWPSVRYAGDQMDLNYYVKVTKLPMRGMRHSCFLNGIAFFRSILHKKMKLLISNPKILLLKGPTDRLVEGKVVFMDSILRQEDNTIVKKIQDFGANLVLIELSMNHNTIEELAAQNITCLTRVRPHTMELVARMTGATPIELQGQAPYNAGVLGSCLEFCVTPMNGPMLVVLKTNVALSQVATIMVSGQSMEELKKVKRVIRKTITAYRSALLLSSFFLQSHQDPGLRFPFLCKYELEVIRTTIKDWSCSRPAVQRVCLYGQDDLPLGAFLIQAAQNSYQQCPDSDHLNHEHGVYFLHEQGLVQLFMTVGEQREVDPKEDITMLRTCTRCGSLQGGKVQLSNRSWELSFYHFLSHFFLEGPKAKCGHQFFRESVFLFQLRSMQVEFQYVAWPTYTLTEVDLAVPSNNSILTQAVFEETKFAAEKVINELLQDIRSLEDFLSSEEATNQDQNPDSSKELDSLKKQVDEVHVSIHSASLSHYPNHLVVETYRRTLYLSLLETQKNFSTTSFTLRSQATRHRHLTTPSNRVRRASRAKNSNVLSSMKLDVEEKSPYSSPVRKHIEAGESLVGLQEGHLSLPLGYFGLCVPVEQHDPLSIIAYSLQTTDYANYIGPFMSTDPRPEDIDSELLYGSGHSHSAHFPKDDEEASEHFKVTVLFARQFQALRLACGLAHLDFLLSISKRADLVASQLGKSKSVFFYSHDKRYLLKLVSAKEILMLEDMAPNYFRHMAKHIYHQMPSQLIKTIGAFTVSIKGKTGEVKKAHYLLTVNLEAIMPANSKIFDLKGTLNPRRYVKDGSTQTKMDLNFIEEYHSLPLCLHLTDKQKLDAGLWNDSLFLAKQNIIDYSLLVIVNEEQKMIATGIIDYMQHYTVDKVVESKYKTVVGREQPTIIDPVVYKTRFREQLMFEYFVGVIS